MWQEWSGQDEKDLAVKVRLFVLTSIVLLGFLFIVLMSACNQKTDEKKMVTIEVQMFSGPESKAMIPTANYWNEHYAQKTGITVRATALDRVGYFGKLETQIAAGLPSPDIVHPYSLHLARLRPYLEPLDEYLKRPDIMTSPDGEKLSPDVVLGKAMATVASPDGKIYMIPKDMSEVILYYRKDLIPKPPDTWPEYVALAKKFTKRLNRKSPTQYGAVMQGKYEMWTFCAALETLWPYGGAIFASPMPKSGFDNPGTVQGFKVFEELSKVGALPEDSVDAEHPEVARLIISGKVAMAIQWNAFYTEALMDPKKYPEIYGKFDIAPPPGVRQADGTTRRMMYVQTICLGINKNSRYKEAAAKFLTWATLGEGARIYAQAGGSSPIRTVWDSRMPYSKLGPWVEAFGEFVPFHPDITDIMMIGSSWVQQVMAGNVSSEEAAKGLDREITDYVTENESTPK